MTPARRLGLAIVLIVFVSDQLLKCWLLYGVGLAENGPFDLTSFMTIVPRLEPGHLLRAVPAGHGSGPLVPCRDFLRRGHLALALDVAQP